MKQLIMIILLTFSVSMTAQVYQITDIQLPEDSRVEIESPQKYFVIIYNNEATFMYYNKGLSHVPKYRVIPLENFTLNFNNTIEADLGYGVTKYWYIPVNERQAEYIIGTFNSWRQ